MDKILVTGATGKLGTEVMNLLLAKVDPRYLAVLVRDPSKAEYFKTKGVSVRKGDYYDYQSLVNAFKGIDKLYFISTNDMTNREQQHENVVKAAIESKIKHIIYTSFQRKDESENSPIRQITGVHIFTEKLIKASGLTYTILRHGLYADFIPVIIGNNVFETGMIYLPAGDGKVAFTLRSDLAAGGVSILTGRGHENKTYEFCADTLSSFNDVAEILSGIKGKTITYVSPLVEEYKDTMIKAGVPATFVSMFAGSAEGINQGEFDFADKTLSNLLGRKCTDLSAFLKTVYEN